MLSESAQGDFPAADRVRLRREKKARSAAIQKQYFFEYPFMIASA